MLKRLALRGFLFGGIPAGEVLGNLQGTPRDTEKMDGVGHPPSHPGRP